MTRKQIISISEEEFIKLYLPRQNELNDNAPFDFGYGGCLYETYGAELEHIKLQPKSCVWTIIEGEESNFIVNGVYFVNRLGYLITAKPWHDDADIEVELEKEDETMGIKHPHIQVQLSGQDGNVFNILGLCSRAAKRAGLPQEEIDAFYKEAMSGDYDKALVTCQAWFDIS